MSFGKNIMRRRRDLKMSQARLAIVVGVSQSNISQYERDLKIPSGEITARICRVLKTTPSVLFGSEIPRKHSADVIGYRKKLIKIAINARIRQEAEALANGMKMSVDDVLKIWEEG